MMYRGLSRLALGLGVLLLAACGDLPHPVGSTVNYSDESYRFDYPDNFIMERSHGASGPFYEMSIRKSEFLDDSSNSGQREAARCFVRILDRPVAPEESESSLIGFLRNNVIQGFRGFPSLVPDALSAEDDPYVHARVRGAFNVQGRETAMRNGLPIGSWDVVFPFLAVGQVSSLIDNPTPSGQVVVDCYVPTRFENLANALTRSVAGSIAATP